MYTRISLNLNILLLTGFLNLIEKKQFKTITIGEINEKKYFELVIRNYPETNYALDSEFKIDLINDILAAKEMYIGRYYLDKKKWIPAINRFKTIVNDTKAKLSLLMNFMDNQDHKSVA